MSEQISPMSEQVSHASVVNIHCADGKVLQVSHLAICRSRVIKEMLGDVDNDGTPDIPCEEINSDVMENLVHMMTHYVSTPLVENEDEENESYRSSVLPRTEFDEEFLPKLDKDMLRKMIEGADFLQATLILEKLCQETARRLDTMTDRIQMRELLNITDPIPNEEETAAIGKKFKWLLVATESYTNEGAPQHD
jgi:hypothetical protein